MSIKIIMSRRAAREKARRGLRRAGKEVDCAAKRVWRRGGVGSRMDKWARRPGGRGNLVGGVDGR